MTEALLEGARSNVEQEIAASSAKDEMTDRVDRLVQAPHHLTLDKEHLLRQMTRLTVDRDQIEPGVPPRPSRELDYVEQALAPLRSEPSADEYPRLVHAMAVVIGIEAHRTA